MYLYVLVYTNIYIYIYIYHIYSIVHNIKFEFVNNVYNIYTFRLI